MAEKTMMATVSAGKFKDGLWHVVVEWDDGTSYSSRESWDNQEQADRAAQTWAIEHYLPDGPAS
jgi:hypothetical protein